MNADNVTGNDAIAVAAFMAKDISAINSTKKSKLCSPRKRKLDGLCCMSW